MLISFSIFFVWETNKKAENDFNRRDHNIITLKTLKYFCINHGARRVFQFEIIINSLVSSFCFIWIPLLWVYGHYKYLHSYSAWVYFRRQNLTSIDVRFWRLKSISTFTLKTLKYFCIYNGDQQGFFQFQIMINVLSFILIPMLWLHGHYKYCHSYSAWIDFRRQNLTSIDVRFWRLKSIHAMWGLTNIEFCTSRQI